MASRELTIVVNALDAFIEKTVKAITLEVHSNLRRPPSEGGTPRDTSFATTNWVATIGVPVARVYGSREAVTSGPSQASISKVAGYRLEQGATYVSNFVRYIQILNAGHSKQAPAGFVQIAITKSVTTVSRFAGRLAS